MLQPSLVAQALEARRDALRASADRVADLYRLFAGVLERLEDGPEDVFPSLGGQPWPGALPVAPGPLALPFPQRFETAEEARGWAAERLRGITTAAVDGSQIPASREFGVPVSLVQVGWFVNPHQPERPYRKEVRDEIVVSEGEELSLFADAHLNQQRFRMEMDAAVELIWELADHPGSVLYIDGSLVLSFAGRMMPEARAAYIDALCSVLAASEEARVPVVGYVDRSYAADLVGLLCALEGLPAGLTDGQILRGRLGVLDRTATFRCARDVLQFYGDRSGDLWFLYLQVSLDGLPVRLDIPRWVAEAGLLEDVVDVTRAEIIAGSGYPYVLETADVTAVLTNQDRIAFFELFHEFARDADLPVSLPAKSASKGRRR